MTKTLMNVIIDGAHNTYLLAHLTLKDGIITAVESTPIPAHAIEPSHVYVTPGFVNCHIHPNQLFDRRMLDALPITELLSAMHTKHNKTDDDRYQQAIFVLIDALKSGATSLYAVASNPVPVIRAFNDLGITGAISCFFNDSWKGIGTPPTQTHFDAIENEFADYFKHQTDTLKIHIGTASILTASNKLLILLNDIATRYDTKVNIHISEGDDCVNQCMIERETTPVRLLHELGILNERWNLIHATTIDEKEATLIAKAGASVIHCPVSNAKTGVGIAPAVAMHAENIRIGLGTDACSNNNTNNIMNEAYIATLLHGALHQNPSALSEDIVFEWLTTNGLKIIDSSQTGKIEVGARADLLLWDLGAPAFTPLPYGKLRSVFINNAPDIKPHTVIINGKELIKNYQFNGTLELDAQLATNQWARSMHKTH